MFILGVVSVAILCLGFSRMLGIFIPNEPPIMSDSDDEYIPGTPVSTSDDEDYQELDTFKEPFEEKDESETDTIKDIKTIIENYEPNIKL